MAHEHKYFMFQIKKEFEPFPIPPSKIAYEMVEYAWLGCNCGEVIKRKVKDESQTDSSTDV